MSATDAVSESPTARKRRARKILKQLDLDYPGAECALRHNSAWELLAATILSAQCTDVRVNKVTPHLFAAYPTVADVAEAPLEHLEDLVRTTGFFRNKAKSLKGSARRIVAVYGGKVPSRIEQLVTLPGVARKTANVVTGTWFGKSTGVVVDTHVRRISRRLALTAEKDPKKIERDLMDLLPRTRWVPYSHQIIHHGRKVCNARRPKCDLCGLTALCPSAHQTP
jgi:endonuclease-3